MILFFVSMYQFVHAQNFLIIPKTGDPIKAYQVSVNDEYILYQSIDATDDGAIRMAINDIILIRKADGSVLDLSEKNQILPTQQAAPDNKKIVDLSKYHGLLLAKGNCVYITSNTNREYEIAAVEELKRLITARGFWKVVDDVEEAHFVMQYGVGLEGKDKGFCYLRTRDSYKLMPNCIYDNRNNKVREFGTLIFAIDNTDETNTTNMAVVQKMMSFSARSWEFALEDQIVLNSIIQGIPPQKAQIYSTKMNEEAIPGSFPESAKLYSSVKNFVETLHQYFYIK